ncbi:MAG: hypothetical protein WB471_01915 [Nocardioides sp.]
MTTPTSTHRPAARLLAVATLLVVPLAGSPALACGEPAGSSRADGISPRIPADFALDEGLRDHGGDGGQRGPSEAVRGLRLDPCAGVSWKPKRRSDRLAVRSFGPESLQVRELLTFRSAARAARVVSRVRSDLAGCGEDTVDSSGRRTQVRVFGLTTGYDDVLWSVTAADDQIGGYLAQVMRVGKAVLLNYDAGEYSRTSTHPGARSLNRNSRDFGPSMCRWTTAGC